MEIITLTQTPVQVRQVNLCDGYWDFTDTDPPNRFSAEFICLSDEGRTQMVLSEEELEKVMQALQEYKKEIKDLHQHPSTDCCDTRRPREELNISYYMERITITCKKGCGCRKDEGE